MDESYQNNSYDLSSQIAYMYEVAKNKRFCHAKAGILSAFVCFWLCQYGALEGDPFLSAIIIGIVGLHSVEQWHLV